MLRNLLLAASVVAASGQAVQAQSCGRTTLVGRWAATLNMTEFPVVADGGAVQTVHLQCRMRFRTNNRVTSQCLNVTQRFAFEAVGTFTINSRCQLNAILQTEGDETDGSELRLQAGVVSAEDGRGRTMSGNLRLTLFDGGSRRDAFFGSLTASMVPGAPGSWLAEDAFDMVGNDLELLDE